MLKHIVKRYQYQLPYPLNIYSLHSSCLMQKYGKLLAAILIIEVIFDLKMIVSIACYETLQIVCNSLCSTFIFFISKFLLTNLTNSNNNWSSLKYRTPWNWNYNFLNYQQWLTHPYFKCFFECVYSLNGYIIICRPLFELAAILNLISTVFSFI